MRVRCRTLRNRAVPSARLFVFAAFLAAPSLCLWAQSAASAPPVEPVLLTSPDHRLQAQFTTVHDPSMAAGGAFVYSVTYDGKPLMNRSAIRLEVSGQPPLGVDVNMTQATSGSGLDDYALAAGKTSHVHDAYNSVRITLTEPRAAAGMRAQLRANRATTAAQKGRTLIVEARAYNGAIAFRYLVPEQEAFRGESFDLENFHLNQEHTEFRVSKDATAWAQEEPDFRGSYEEEYLRLPVSALRSHGLIGLPLLMHLPGVAWMAITEAGLEGNGAMYLTGAPGGGVQSVLAPRFDGIGVETATLPHHSAWRVLLVGDEPGRLLESNVITDLNPPSRIEDASWIHPGKASWEWWSGHIGSDGKPAFNTETMKYYVDFAAQSGFPYMLVDAGWSAPGDITKLNGSVDIPALVQYAAKKNVKIWIWVPARRVAEQMNRAFSLYEKWGVVGVKIDFVMRDDQVGIQFYYDAAKEAAAHHLMLDFHGPTKPTGLNRTYPNVLSYEAVLGMEQSKVNARDNPLHRTIISFARMLAGPMDYTPGGFDNVTEDSFVPRGEHPMVMGTRAQQLALYVVDLAPIQMVSDSPAAYAHQPAFQFIRDAPAAWDETRVLSGVPGESITVARRSGTNWFVGSITNWTARDVTIPLDFLGKGQYRAEIYEDAHDADRNPKGVSIRQQTVEQSGRLSIHLAPGGGCAIRLTPVPK